MPQPRSFVLLSFQTRALNILIHSFFFFFYCGHYITQNVPFHPSFDKQFSALGTITLLYATNSFINSITDGYSNLYLQLRSLSPKLTAFSASSFGCYSSQVSLRCKQHKPSLANQIERILLKGFRVTCRIYGKNQRIMLKHVWGIEYIYLSQSRYRSEPIKTPLLLQLGTDHHLQSQLWVPTARSIGAGGSEICIWLLALHCYCHISMDLIMAFLFHTTSLYLVDKVWVITAARGASSSDPSDGTFAKAKGRCQAAEKDEDCSHLLQETPQTHYEFNLNS